MPKSDKRISLAECPVSTTAPKHRTNPLLLVKSVFKMFLSRFTSYLTVMLSAFATVFNERNYPQLECELHDNGNQVQDKL